MQTRKKVRTKKQRKRDIHAAAEYIISSFVWGATPEGHNYWSGVYNKLRYMAGAKDAN